MRISEIEENFWKKVKKPFGPSRKEIWAKRLATKPVAPPATPQPDPEPAPVPATASGTFGGSFVQPTTATATAKAAPTAPQAKPRMSVRAATGPVYSKGQKKNVGGVQYTWDGTVWRNASGQSATPAIAKAIDQQSSQTS